MILFHVVVPVMHGEVCEPRRACPRDVEAADISDDRGRVGELAEVRKFVCDVSVEVRIGGRGSRAEFNMGRTSRARIEADVRQYPPGPPPPLFEDSQNWALMGSPIQHWNLRRRPRLRRGTMPSEGYGAPGIRNLFRQDLSGGNERIGRR